MDDLFPPLVVLGVICLILAAALTSAPTQADAAHALQVAGYTAEVGDRSWMAWGCAQGELVSYPWQGTGPAGEAGSGKVCCSIIGGCVIRH